MISNKKTIKKELKFIHITKCAGTAIENAGKTHNVNWGRFHKEYGWWHRIFTDVYKHIRDKYDWFVVVRNPYDRILSEYYCKWGGVGINIHDTAKKMNQFLIEKINKRNMSGEHYTEQYKYIVPDSTIHIIHFENLEEEFNKLMKEYNLEHIKLEKTNSRPDNLKFKIDDFSNELINLINKIYDKDFTTFGYTKINRLNKKIFQINNL
jgi:hypothetical protein